MKRDMERIAAGAPSKSEKMRKLAAAGYSRQQIADFLAVRYQFVRNVLVEHEKRQRQLQSGLAEEGKEWAGLRAVSAAPGSPIAVSPDGSAVIPASVLAQAGLKAGDSFIPDVAGEGDVRLLSGIAALRRAQELVRESLGGETDPVDEILEARRQDARNLAKDAENRDG